MKSNLTYSPFYFLYVLGVAPTFLDKQKKSDFCVPLDNKEQQNISVPLDNANQPNINNPLDNSGISVNNEAQHTCTILYKCTSTNFLHLLIFFSICTSFFLSGVDKDQYTQDEVPETQDAEAQQGKRKFVAVFSL